MKKMVTVGGYVTDADRQKIERRLKAVLKPILGDLDIEWRGRTPDHHPSFSAKDLEPGQALRLRPALNDVFGAGCTVSLKEKAAAAA